MRIDLKNTFIGIISAILLILSAGCGSSKETQVNEIKSSDISLNKMQSVCELATLECFYHNTAKYKDTDKILWWNTKTELWIEYSGVVKIGIKPEKLDMSVDGNVVTVTIPDAEIISYKVHPDSLDPGKYIVGQEGLGAKSIKAKDQTEAFKAAEQNMKETVEEDYTLLLQGQQRAQELIERYIKNVGDIVGKDYVVKWNKL